MGIAIFLMLLAVLAGTPDTARAQPVHGEVEPDNQNWRLAWSDEFEGSAIDPNRWRLAEDCWGGGNNERQCYTARASNSFVSAGVLHIVARRESYTGPAVRSALGQSGAPVRSLPYTSARLSTNGGGDWTYGRVEARILLPSGQGTWPAFWMLPTDERYGAWPRSGEIDIMEAINLGAACRSCAGGRENRISGAVHFWSNGRHAQISAATPVDETSGFHLYAIEWRPDGMEWFVDGRSYLSVSSDRWGQVGGNTSGRPFDQRFHLVLNLAVGGNWPETENDEGVESDDFPKEMLVDWIRVYSSTAPAARR